MSARSNPAAVALVRRCWSLMVRSNWCAVATLPLEVLHRGATAGRRKTGHCKVRITTIATTRYDASRPLATMDRDQYEGAVGYTG